MSPTHPFLCVRDIFRAPSIAETVGNFSSRDTLVITGMTLPSLAAGYAVGARGVRVPSMYAMGAIGLFGGFLLSYQNSWGRLTGYAPPEK